MSQLEQQLSQATAKLIQLQTENRPTQRQQQKLEQLQAEYSLTQATQTAYHSAMQQLALCASFAIDGGGFQSATEVRASLQQQLNSLCSIANVLPLPNSKPALDKFQQQIPAIAAVVNTWLTWYL
jgi:multidrug efflux pump subunit AcrA (membrane-fusion protein)